MEHLLDDGARAGNPGELELSPRKYRRLRGIIGLWWEHIARKHGNDVRGRTREHLIHGDTRAAVVVAVNPLVIATYTDELDCVVMLQYPRWLARAYRLTPGSRLLAVFCYQKTEEVAVDLDPGPDDSGRWTNAVPHIAEFLSDELQKIERRKREIPEDEWRRCADLAAEYRRRHGTRAREGGLFFNGFPPDPVE